MDYRRLGASGLSVPALSFGTGTFAGRGEFFQAWGSTDVAEKVEIQQITMVGGAMSVNPVAAGLTISPGDKVVLAPGGYFLGLEKGNSIGNVILILLCSILGILGSYGVAWFGIRINTVANSRTAFSALRGNPLATLGIPLRSGMSVGLLLVAGTDGFFELKRSRTREPIFD